MPKLWEALLTLAILIAALAVGIIIFGVDPHVPMFVGVMAAAIMALHLGYKWDEVEKSMMDGIYKALQSICILIIVGILIGVWINAGVVPTMIYYGLKVLKPAIFFIACVLICSITSLATGTSWGTMAIMTPLAIQLGYAVTGDVLFATGMTGAVLSGAILSWITCINELSSSVMLYGGKTSTISVAIYTEVVRNSFGTAAALASILTVSTVISLLIFLKVSKGRVSVV